MIKTLEIVLGENAAVVVRICYYFLSSTSDTFLKHDSIDLRVVRPVNDQLVIKYL